MRVPFPDPNRRLTVVDSIPVIKDNWRGWNESPVGNVYLTNITNHVTRIIPRIKGERKVEGLFYI